MTKRQYDSLFFTKAASLLIGRRETIHMFHSCRLLAERAIHLYYHWVELLRTTKCKIKFMLGCFFPDKEGQDSVCGVWFVSEVCFSGACFNGLRSVKITVCVPRKHAR